MINGRDGIGGSIINSASTGLEEYETGMTPLSKDDVFSYFVNYIKNDLYGNNNEAKSGYVVEIDGLNKDMSYKDAYNSLNAEKYYIKYSTTQDDGTKIVKIQALTQ